MDLNLVVAFDALARELSVTRAAQRVGVTQSAMSHALRRLRDLLGDELLVRGRSGMVLTPRADSLVVPLRSGLVTLGRALSQPIRIRAGVRAPRILHRFAGSVRRASRPPLLERIRDEAPGVDVRITSIDDRRLPDQLETGEVDVAITPLIEQIGSEAAGDGAPGLLRRTLLRDRFACLIRANHPIFEGNRRGRPSKGDSLSLEAYTELSHVMVSPSGEGPGLVDQALAQRGLVRRIALKIPHFYSALAIVARSDLILTAPAALSRLVSENLSVVTLPAPLRLPRHSVNLTWHERFSKDQGHVWLRRLVSDVARAAYSGESVMAEQRS